DNKNGINGSIIDNSNNGIDINISQTAAYPNPADAQLTFTFESNVSSFGTITVSDALGRVVFDDKVLISDEENKFLINTDHFANGIYYIRVTVANQAEKTIRFLKAR
ncbi:MAG: T9SS type A sorting domain-containing protein, partial [Bacteroidota bacterium]